MTAQEPASSAWDLDSVRPLAEEFGITDREALCRELASAYHFATFGLFNAVRGDTSLVPPQLRGFVDSEQAQRRVRLSRLHSAMTIELASQADDPLLRSATANSLRKALARFGAGLMSEIFKPLVSGKKRRSRTNRFVVALAPAWRRLTGETPKAWVDGTGEQEAGGRYFDFVCAVCDFFKFDRPSVGTIREGYAPRGRRKPRKAIID